MKAIGSHLSGVSAVYCIYNDVNDKVYIGSSNNLQVRLQKHRAMLRHNKHLNPGLQAEWNSLGEDRFDFKILEFCPVDKLLEREDYYIHQATSSYNIASGTINYNYPTETRKRMSVGRKAGFANGTIRPYQNKRVYKYDLDGNLIAEYKNIKIAAIEENLHRSNITRCLNGTYSQMNGFRWSTEKCSNIGKYVKPKVKMPNKYIYRVNDGTTVLEFDGCKACADFFGVSISAIDQVIRNKNTYRKKYNITRIAK